MNEVQASENFDDTNGVNLKIGYHVDSIFSVEFNIDHLPGFEWAGSGNYGIANIGAEIDITTFMVAGKISPDFGSKAIRPFMVVGIGIMHSKLDINASIPGYTASASVSDIGSCLKVGAGLDVFVHENVSVGFEVAYIVGSVDLSIEGQDIINECNYTNCTMGVAYHF